MRMKHVLIIFMFLAIYVFSTLHACVIEPEYRVQIQNLIPDSNILVHCKSKNDDLGDHQLSYNDDFHWKFCEATFHNTLYFCHFSWDSQEQVFDVFNETMYDLCNLKNGHINPWNWSAMTDGIYFMISTRLLGESSMTGNQNMYEQAAICISN